MRRLPILTILLSCCGLPVLAQLKADFLTDKSSSCGPLVAVFAPQVEAPGPVSFSWDLGNGNTSAFATPRAIYTTPGDYTVTMTVTSGSQTATVTHTITIYPLPTPSIGIPEAKVCGARPVSFDAATAAGPGANYLWDFGDGTTQNGSSVPTTHAYSAQGVYAVSLTETDSHGCVATVTQSSAVVVLAALTPSFTTTPRVLCTVNSPVNFVNNSTGPGSLDYQWNFGDGGGSTQTSPVYTYAAKGTYTVILTVTSTAGCVASDTQTNVLHVADFQTNFSAPSAICQGKTVTITDVSTPAPGSSVWMVDGSAVGVGGSLTYSSNTPGNHVILLTNTYGTCMQSATKTITVNAVPVIPPFDAVVQGVCGAPATVNFLDHTPGATGWTWAFNYNPYVSSQSVGTGGPANSYPYAYNGSFNVQLTVTNGAGCVASVIQPVTLSSPVVGIIETDNEPEGSCGPPLTKHFSCPQLANLASWTWNFGDGTTSTDATPTHVFSGPGGYNTTLTWTDKNGCTGVTNAIPTIITTPPNLNFTASATTVCVGQPVSFTVPNQFSSAWVSWFFGDGGENPYSSGNMVYTYNAPGVYSVKLDVDDFAGCDFTNTLTNYITVLSSPTLAFTAANTCDSPRANVTFSVTAGNGATAIQWQFGDGMTQQTAANITNLTHTYTQNGYYNVYGTATDGGCTTTREISAIVELKPLSFHLGVSATAICPVTFIWDTLHQVFPPGSGNDAYAWTNVQWYYGDGTSFQGPQNWVYPGSDYTSELSGFKAGESGLYAVTTNTLNCKDTTNVAPIVIGGIEAAYQVVKDGQCYQQPVVLQDVSVTAPGDPVVGRLWDFGDGITQQASNTVQHIYVDPGTYAVKLTVTDQNGCASATQTVVRQVVVDGPRANFQAQGGATNFPQGSVVGFINNSNTSNTSNPVFSWDFGDGTTSSLIYPTHLYATPGVYTVTLTAQDGAGGCVSKLSLTLTIQPVNNAFSKTASYVSSGACPPVLVHFTNLSRNYRSFTWDFGDGETVSNVPDPNHVYTLPGVYPVTLTVLGNNGQTTTTVDSVIVVKPGTVLSAVTPAVCLGQTVTLQSTGNQRVKGYAWDFGDGTVIDNADSAASHVYTKAGSYAAKLVVADSLGCPAAAAATDAIDVLAPPVVALTPSSAFVCLGQGVPIKASGGATYSWSPGGSLSDSTIPAPVATPVVNTLYKVTVADNIGCTNSDSIVVRVVRPDTVRVSPDPATICPGQAVQLTATGADSYRWIGGVEGLSGTSIPNPVAKPMVSTVFEVVGSDPAGCFRDTVAVVVDLLEQPTVNAGTDPEVLAGTPVTIAAVGSPDVVSWLWTPAIDLSCAGCAQPVCTPTQTRQYIVQVEAADGCMASDTVVVKLLCDETRVRIPEAFSPNGDGHNDRMVILGIGEVDHLVVYDRWGIRVFERDHFYTGDIDAQWDGMMGGQPAPTGVYAYFVEMTCPAGGKFTRMGTVVLVR